MIITIIHDKTVVIIFTNSMKRMELNYKSVIGTVVMFSVTQINKSSCCISESKTKGEKGEERRQGGKGRGKQRRKKAAGGLLTQGHCQKQV